MHNPNLRRFSILFVDDEPAVLAALRRLFRDVRFEIVTAESGAAALDILNHTPVDAALIDLKMPEMSGLELLSRIHEAWPGVQVIMLTGHGGIDEAVQAIKRGAVDFLVKPYEPERLQLRVRQLYHIWCLEQENRSLKEQVRSKFGFDQLIGNAAVILALKRMISQVSASDANILIQGEEGTGKEVVAHAIHRHSARGDAPFVPVDCGASGESMMDGELFGRVEEVSSGKAETTTGLIRSADKGTLFLNEVSALSMATQVKLLRTIQEKVVRPVGSSRSFPIDVRFLAGTHLDLLIEIAEGRFRQDLYYRLNVVELKVPPLRERLEDIPVLARYFIDRFQTPASPVRKLSEPALACLQAYGWPGNVRELEHVIRRAVAVGRHAEIALEDLPDNLSGRSAAEPPELACDRMEAYEMSAIRNALAKCAGHRKKTAQLLGIGEATLYRKLVKYQIS